MPARRHPRVNPREDRTMAFPISQRAAVDPDESTAEAIADWHYRVARATASELRTATESSRCFPYAADQACTGFARRRKERAEAQLRLTATPLYGLGTF